MVLKVASPTSFYCHSDPASCIPEGLSACLKKWRVSKLTKKKIQIVFIPLSSPSSKGLLHLAAPQKLGIIFFSYLSEHQGVIQPECSLPKSRQGECLKSSWKLPRSFHADPCPADRGRAMGVLMNGIPSPPLCKTQLNGVCALGHVRR